jgi:hypothetical protein
MTGLKIPLTNARKARVFSPFFLRSRDRSFSSSFFFLHSRHRRKSYFNALLAPIDVDGEGRNELF